MSTILDLVDVQFVDNTGYPVPVESLDSMGLVFDYHWGPSDSLQTMTEAQFFQNYPESLPLGASQISANQNIYGYAQIKQAFRNGLNTVEVCRFATSVDGIARTNKWKYSQLAIDLKHGTGTTSVYIPGSCTAETSQFGSDPDTLYISYRYAGCPPQSFLPTGFTALALKVEEIVAGKKMRVSVIAGKPAYNASTQQVEPFEVTKVLEVWEGGIAHETQNGVSLYLPDVMADSQFIACYYGGTDSTWSGSFEYGNSQSGVGIYHLVVEKTYSDLVPAGSFEDEATAIADVYVTKYGDIELSSAKMIISPFSKNQPVDFSGSTYDDDTAYVNDRDDEIGTDFITHRIQSLNEAIQLVSEKRYNCITALGYTIPAAGEADNFTKAAIASWLSWDKTNEKFRTDCYTNGARDIVSSGSLTATTPYRYQYSVAVTAREYLTVFGRVISSSAVGGWCGATARVAKNVRLNQLASAKQYGSYIGNLEKALKFGDVNYLHGIGATSIYTAAQGPRIFGIHTLCPTFSSYFANTNVMRVTAAVLNQVLPASLDAVHTQVAADPIAMSTFETSLNGILEGYIATRDLKTQSNAICNGTINTEQLTERGKKLNIILNLWYINLTEKISIKIVATDESVTVEFKQ